MEFGAVIEIISAFLVVIGMICLAHYISETFFMPEEFSLSVKILDDRAREDADVLLSILKKSVWKRTGKGICVIVSKKYENDKDLSEQIEKLGATRYITDDR